MATTSQAEPPHGTGFLCPQEFLFLSPLPQANGSSREGRLMGPQFLTLASVFLVLSKCVYSLFAGVPEVTVDVPGGHRQKGRVKVGKIKGWRASSTCRTCR